MARRRPGLDPAPRPISEVVERTVVRAERSMRLVNKKRFCELTGFDRKTLDDWIAKGAPVEGESGRGAEILVDVRAIWKWREEQVAAKALEDAMSDGEEVVGFMGIRDPAKAIKAQFEYIKMAATKKLLVHHDPLNSANERAFGIIRQAIMAIPDRIFREMAGLPEPLIRKWRKDALGYCRAALEEGARTVAAAIPAPDDDA